MKKSPLLTLVGAAILALGAVVPAAADTPQPQPTVPVAAYTYTCPSAAQVSAAVDDTVTVVRTTGGCDYEGTRGVHYALQVDDTFGSVTEYREYIEWSFSRTNFSPSILEHPSLGAGAFSWADASPRFLSWQLYDGIVAQTSAWSPDDALALANLWAKHIHPDVYTTPGEHEVNGRKWRTSCEPYSQTMRCTTEIWATKTTSVGGRYVSKTDWTFNNLTYLPKLTRAQWKTNPIGQPGSWTATDGRKWMTICDTPETGGNGCRSYVMADLVAATKQPNGTYTFRTVRDWYFNNIVQFKA